MKRNRSMIIAFAGPATIFFLATFIYPIIRTLVMSFFSIQEITDPIGKWKFNGIGNYVSLMQTPLYVTSWVNLFKIFVIGGGVSKAGQYLVDRIRGHYEHFTPISKNKAKIGLATLGNDAGIYGAAKLILD